MQKILDEGLAALHIAAPAGATKKMEQYAALLVAQNGVMNLTAITEPTQVAQMHFLDSAALLGSAEFAGKSLIDVGTGAGFPGLALKLLEPSLSLTLLDGLKKRLTWLETVAQTLGIKGVRFLHARAEEQALLQTDRDIYDLATARAVADLSVLTELCLPFVKVGGRFLAMKAADCAAELSGAEATIKALGGRLLPTFTYVIPGTEITRHVVVIEKIAATPKGYPRRWAKIQTTTLK